MSDPFAGRVVVVSPHLDDGVLSLGAAISRATAAGIAEVVVLTVCGGDVTSEQTASGWDVLGGFATEGEATRARRTEDAAACRLVGAAPVWLPFRDGAYTRDRDDEATARAVAEATANADAAFIPGFPLLHHDHVWLAQLLLRARLPCRSMWLYAEQPYTHRSRGIPPAPPDSVRSALSFWPAWSRVRVGIRDRARKQKAIRTYRSQLRGLRFGGVGHARLIAMLAHEAVHGGEAIARVESERR